MATVRNIVIDQNADVRTVSNDKEAEIAALADMDAVKAYQNHPVVETRKVAEYDDDDNAYTWNESTQAWDLVD